MTCRKNWWIFTPRKFPPRKSPCKCNPRRFPVFVTGQVVHPGKVLSDHPITALEAVMEAGGFDYNTANMKEVKVVRNENGVMQHFTVNLKAVLAKARKPNLFISSRRTSCYVPERFSAF